MRKVNLDKQYIIDRTTIHSTTECWEWKLHRNKNWYWQLKNKGIHLMAHRVSYWIYNWYFDNDLFICHKCDNPSCCNPDHLFVWTAQDNYDDMVNKWRRVNWDQTWNNKAWIWIIAWWMFFKNYCEAWKYFWISDNWIRKRIKLGWEWYSLA